MCCLLFLNPACCESFSVLHILSGTTIFGANPHVDGDDVDRNRKIIVISFWSCNFKLIIIMPKCYLPYSLLHSRDKYFPDD